MRLIGLVLVALLASGCATAMPVADEPASPPMATSDPESPVVAIMAFAGNGDTFLDAIAAVETERGAPDGHRFVQVDAAGGMVWQGEELRYGGELVALMQPVNSGGATALKIDARGEIPWDAALADAAMGSDDAFTRPAPEIRFVRARQGADGLWAFDVTLAYPDTGWEDYADGWHIATPDGAILGTRILLHPHVDEQPFTRSLGSVAVPAGVNEVIVRAHTLVSGYGAETVTVPLAQSAQTAQYEVVRP